MTRIAVVDNDKLKDMALKQHIQSLCPVNRTGQECIRLVDGRLIIDELLSYGEKMNGWSQKEIFDKDLTKLTNKELWARVETFVDMQSRMYSYGTRIAVLDFQDFAFVEGNLNKILDEKYQKKKGQLTTKF